MSGPWDMPGLKHESRSGAPFTLTRNAAVSLSNRKRPIGSPKLKASTCSITSQQALLGSGLDRSAETP